MHRDRGDFDRVPGAGGGRDYDRAGRERRGIAPGAAVEADDDYGSGVPRATYSDRLCTVPLAEAVYWKASAEPATDSSLLDWIAELPASSPGDDAAPTTGLAAEVAAVAPPALLAVTTTRSVWPTSLAASLWVDAVAPPMLEQCWPEGLQSCH